MRVYPVQIRQNNFAVQNSNLNRNQILYQNEESKLKAYNSAPPPIYFHDRIAHSAGVASVTFTGEGKNVHQILSLAYENKATGLGEDSQGGLGVVTAEAPESFRKHEGLDVRTIMPFHEYNNPKGGLKFLYIKDVKQVKDETNPQTGEIIQTVKLPDEIEAKWFMSAEPGQTLEDFARSHNYNPEDLRYVIQSEPKGNDANSLSKYCLIEPTSAAGEIERMSDIDIGETQKVKYQLFKISKDNPGYNKLSDTPNYWMYTQELAKTPRPYTYGPEGYGGMNSEIINSDFCRAVLKAGEQMNTEEFGYFNTANFWGHDRTVAMLVNHLADESARGNEFYNGTITHFTMHNPGRNYQGFTDNPFAFARAIFSVEDVEKMRNHPQYELLQNFNARGWENLTEVEKKFVRNAFDPFIGVFKDFFGTYNITKVALVGQMVNPKNTTSGTVSPNFDKEMKNPNMDVAPGIEEELRSLTTISPLNGSTPANLGLDNNNKDFGAGSNILSEQKGGFTPFKYTGDNIEEIIKIREANSKWLTGIIADAAAKGQEELNKVFFNEAQITQGTSVFGSLSKIEDGDMLVMGWGRPDEQKGYPITFEGFLKFLKREDVPKERKLKVKLLVGAGRDPWDKNARDFKLIQKLLKEIQELDGGIYAHNVMYVDGLFPNKLVGCATHCIFTSRREMCGITPLEAKTAGVPYITTATGGPVDYTNSLNGWLTKTAPEMTPDFDNLTWDTPADIIDDARIERSSNDISDCFKAMTDEYFDNKPSYIARCKKNIEEKLDWHNNDEFNGGKSANKMYRNDIWHIDEGWEARDKSPMKRLIGSVTETAPETIQETAEEIKTTVKSKTNNVKNQIKHSSNKWVKIAVGTGIAIAAAGTAAYVYIKKYGKKPIMEILKPSKQAEEKKGTTDKTINQAA